MKIKVMTIAMSMAILGTVSCSKSDLYDEAAQNTAKFEKAVSEYKANFVKKYGEVDPNQSWDFSNNDVVFGYNTASSARTRAPYAWGASQINPNPISLSYPGWFTLEGEAFTNLKTVFLEGEDHDMSGTFFDYTSPSNDFTILPIFMGQSGGDFELWLHVDGVAKDKKIWSKWQNIKCDFPSTPTMFNPSTHTGYQAITASWNDGGQNCVNALGVQSQAVTIKNVPANKSMYFYLKITTAASGYNTRGDVLTSVEGYIKEYVLDQSLVDKTKLPGYDANKEIKVKLIGCEDASTSNSDKDFNDVIFLMYGQPTTPITGYVKDLVKYDKKRYLIEDLGDTNDTDFNDIVVDVIAESTATIKVDANDVPLPGYENPEYTLKSTSAVIRALGGTLDIQVNVGDKSWRKSVYYPETYTEMMNTTNPDYTAVLGTIENIKNFTLDSNNISVTVYGKNGEQSQNQVNFPLKGEIPMMIATDTSFDWAKERKSIDFKSLMGVEE